MKFTIAAIVLTFALFANAHVVVDIAKPHSHVGSHGPALVNTGYGGNGGYGGWGWGGDAYHGYSVGYPHGAPHITLHTTGNLGGHGGWEGGWNGGEGAGAGAGAGAAGAGAGHGHHEGKYVAANRGAVHIAPLTGHIQSVKSTNEQPAPGTTW